MNIGGVGMNILTEAQVHFWKSETPNFSLYDIFHKVQGMMTISYPPSQSNYVGVLI